VSWSRFPNSEDCEFDMADEPLGSVSVTLVSSSLTVEVEIVRQTSLSKISMRTWSYGQEGTEQGVDTGRFRQRPPPNGGPS